MERTGLRTFMFLARQRGWNTEDRPLMRRLFFFASKLPPSEGYKPSDADWHLACEGIRKWNIHAHTHMKQVTGELVPKFEMAKGFEAARGGMAKLGDLVVLEGGLGKEDEAAA